MAQLLPVHSGIVGPLVLEPITPYEARWAQAAALARAGVRWVARKVCGLLGKWLGALAGALVSPAGAIVGAAIGIAVGCAAARLACAAM